MNNNITQLQNEQGNIELLAAQRELYSSAKRLYILQLCGNVLFPVIIAVTSLIYSEIVIYGAMYGIGFFAIDVFILFPAMVKRKTKAAKAQERFDCTVLGIANSPLEITDDITDKEIQINYDRHKRNASDIETLQNWYPAEIGTLNDMSVARLICQRTNCWWDSKLRRRFIRLIIFLLIAVPLIVIVIGILKDFKRDEIILALSTLIPFAMFLNRELFEQIEANKRLERLDSFIKQTLKDLKENTLKISLNSLSRDIQDEIFEHRSKSPLVLDAVYKWFRTMDNKEMEKMALALIADMKSIDTKKSN